MAAILSGIGFLGRGKNGKKEEENREKNEKEKKNKKWRAENRRAGEENGTSDVSSS